MVRDLKPTPEGTRQGNEQSCREPAIYRIRVHGIIGRQWSGWFDGMQIVPQANGETTMIGPVVDQAALHGTLTKIRDLNMPLISVEQLRKA